MKKLNRNQTYEIKAQHSTSAADTLQETLDFYAITQTELAQHIHVSQSYISDILNRKKFMSSDVALAIQEATGISAGLLLRLDLSYQMAHATGKKTARTVERFDWATI